MGWEIMVTILAVISSALAIVPNIRKLSDNIKQEAEWRVGTHSELARLVEKLNDLLEAYKKTSKDVHELIISEVSISRDLESIWKEIGTLWKRTDEHKGELDALQRRILSSKAYRPADDE